MELLSGFFCVSTLFLLAVHLFDHAVEPRLRSGGVQFAIMPDNEVPTDEGPGWGDSDARYDRAA